MNWPFLILAFFRVTQTSSTKPTVLTGVPYLLVIAGKVKKCSPSFRQVHLACQFFFLLNVLKPAANIRLLVFLCSWKNKEHQARVCQGMLRINLLPLAYVELLREKFIWTLWRIEKKRANLSLLQQIILAGDWLKKLVPECTGMDMIKILKRNSYFECNPTCQDTQFV